MKEKQRILKLLEDGKITAEDAVKLLEALKKSLGPGEFIRIMHTHPHIKRIRRHRLDPSHKKVIIKMMGDCCEDRDDTEFLDLACCD
jgi:predicted nucleic acid-binding protein